MTSTRIVRDATTGFLRTVRKVCNQTPAYRIAVAELFLGLPVVVTYDRLRGADANVGRTLHGTVLAVATVEHGTCPAVVVLTLDPDADGNRVTHALPLSQVLHIEQTVPLVADQVRAEQAGAR